jgi:hypothetical protein
MTAETDAELADRLGLARPNVSSPNLGKCPGGTEYGHGMSLTTVHGGGCCEAWNAARQPETEPEAS